VGSSSSHSSRHPPAARADRPSLPHHVSVVVSLCPIQPSSGRNDDCLVRGKRARAGRWARARGWRDRGSDGGRKGRPGSRCRSAHPPSHRRTQSFARAGPLPGRRRVYLCSSYLHCRVEYTDGKVEEKGGRQKCIIEELTVPSHVHVAARASSLRPHHIARPSLIPPCCPSLWPPHCESASNACLLCTKYRPQTSVSQPDYVLCSVSAGL